MRPSARMVVGVYCFISIYLCLLVLCPSDFFPLYFMRFLNMESISPHCAHVICELIFCYFFVSWGGSWKLNFPVLFQYIWISWESRSALNILYKWTQLCEFIRIHSLQIIQCPVKVTGILMLLMFLYLLYKMMTVFVVFLQLKK